MGFVGLTRTSKGIYGACLRYASGETSDPMRLRAFTLPGVTSPPTLIALVSETSELTIVSLLDGTTRVLPEVRLSALSVGLMVSPDGKWLAARETFPRDATTARRGIDRLHLVDVARGRSA